MAWQPSGGWTLTGEGLMSPSGSVFQSDDLLTIAQASEILGREASTLRRMAIKGALNARRFGKSHVLDVSEVIRYGRENLTERGRHRRARIVIPESIRFSDLKLKRESDGSVTFDTAPILAICEASGLDPRVLQNEDNLSALLAGWYAKASKAGEIDPEMKALVNEAFSEWN